MCQIVKVQQRLETITLPTLRHKVIIRLGNTSDDK